MCSFFFFFKSAAHLNQSICLYINAASDNDYVNRSGYETSSAPSGGTLCEDVKIYIVELAVPHNAEMWHHEQILYVFNTHLVIMEGLAGAEVQQSGEED